MKEEQSLLKFSAKLPPENDMGNIEYKLKLISPSNDRLQHLITQLQWRLGEGNGSALYEIGVSDKGNLVGLSDFEFTETLSTLKLMADALNAHLNIEHTRIINDLKVAEVCIRYTPSTRDFQEVRVALCGGTNSGKSTLLAVLCLHTQLDNSRGKARLNLLKHRHEIETGKTSSISHEIIGFNDKQLVNYATNDVTTWHQICKLSTKIVLFLDLPGFDRFQKTTLSGLLGLSPDYSLLTVAADTSPDKTSLEHLYAAIHLSIPIFIVITKIDVATPQQLTRTITSLYNTLKDVKRIPLVIESSLDFEPAMKDLLDLKTVAVFLMSSVTGENLSLLQDFFYSLPKTISLPTTDIIFSIDEIFHVPNVGLIVAGILKSGTIKINSHIRHLIGPLKNSFVNVDIVSIHRQRCPVDLIQAGQTATLAINFLDTGLRRGNVILGKEVWDVSPIGIKSFHVLFTVYKDVSIDLKGVVFCNSIRQVGKITSFKEVQDGVLCEITFLVDSEWMSIGSIVFFLLERDTARFVGKVVKNEKYI